MIQSRWYHVALLWRIFTHKHFPDLCAIIQTNMTSNPMWNYNGERQLNILSNKFEVYFKVTLSNQCSLNVSIGYSKSVGNLILLPTYFYGFCCEFFYWIFGIMTYLIDNSFMFCYVCASDKCNWVSFTNEVRNMRRFLTYFQWSLNKPTGFDW